MVEIIADNITSPLGLTTQETYEAVKSGRSGLTSHEHTFGLPEPFYASMFSEEQWNLIVGEHTGNRFEALMEHSIDHALADCDINPSSPRVLFVVSTTKGDVAHPESPTSLPSLTALQVAEHYGNPNMPVTVCNACVSGLTAQLVAMRALESGRFDYAVVCGIDLLSDFIISGFQSLKSLSTQACRPFDIDRCGLNLGEACGTMILKHVDNDEGKWLLVRGALRNDAFHISNPSKTGEGSYRAIRSAIGRYPVSELACVNAHGTSTLYNDEMEAKALYRAGLSNVPTNSLKGYLGHTLGAAGVIEAILCMHSLDEGVIIGTKGFEELGVSRHVNIVERNCQTDKRAFLKLLSGFGGSNAAMLYQKGGRNED